VRVDEPPELIVWKSASVRVTVCVWLSSFDVVSVLPAAGGVLTSALARSTVWV